MQRQRPPLLPCPNNPTHPPGAHSLAYPVAAQSVTSQLLTCGGQALPSLGHVQPCLGAGGRGGGADSRDSHEVHVERERLAQKRRGDLREPEGEEEGREPGAGGGTQVVRRRGRRRPREGALRVRDAYGGWRNSS